MLFSNELELIYLRISNIAIYTNNFIRPINGTLTGTTTQGQIGPGSNGNDGVLTSPKDPELWAWSL